MKIPQRLTKLQEAELELERAEDALLWLKHPGVAVLPYLETIAKAEARLEAAKAELSRLRHRAS